MPEPTSSGVAGAAAAYKAFGGTAAAAASGATLAAVVVMLMTPPRDKREWTVGLISTVVSSICGGAITIEYFQLHHWAFSTIGLYAMGGVIFPYNPDGRQLSDFIEQVKPIRNTETVFGVGVGMDGNGFGGSPGPRGAPRAARAGSQRGRDRIGARLRLPARRAARRFGERAVSGPCIHLALGEVPGLAREACADGLQWLSAPEQSRLAKLSAPLRRARLGTRLER